MCSNELGVAELNTDAAAGSEHLRQAVEALDGAVARPEIEVVDAALAREILGPERIHNEVKRRTSEPGVATGLAVTGAGGEILFVEAQAMPGSGRLIVTGQLGDVMKESAQAALSFVRARGADLGSSSPRTSSPPTTSTCTCRPARCPRTVRRPA